MALVDIFTAVSASAYLTGVTCRFGGQAVNFNASPPRVIWEPLGFTISGARRQGVDTTSRGQRSLGTRRHRVKLHVWAVATDRSVEGADFAAVEALFDKVVWAIHEQAWGSVELEAGDALEDGSNDLGRCLILPVTFDVPVVLPTASDANTTQTFTQAAATIVEPGDED